MQEEPILINRYDLMEISPEHGQSIFVIMSKYVLHSKTKVMYIEGKNSKGVFQSRQQVRFFDIDKIIKYYSDKIKTDNDLFNNKWKRNLSIVEKLRDSKIEEFSDV